MNDQNSSDPVSRRDFVKVVTMFLSAAMGVVLGLPVIGYIISPAVRTQKSEDWIPLGPLKDFSIGTPTKASFTRSKVNGWEKTTKSYGVFIVRKDETRVKVLSNVCTHLGCLVSWHPDIQEYVSPCHDGHFDINGNVTKGPPPRPLDQFETKVENGKLFIHLLNV